MTEAHRLRDRLAGLTPEERRDHLVSLSDDAWREHPMPDYGDEIPGQCFVAVLRDGTVVSQGPLTVDGLRDVRVHTGPDEYDVVAPPGPSAPGYEWHGPSYDPDREEAPAFIR